MLILLKFLSWSIYLGSGTSGGTLAPLLIIGGGIGSLLGGVANSLFPGLDLDTHVAGLVGMAAIFAGASHAFLASVVFAFEATQQPMSLLPLLAGAGAAYLTTLLMSRTSIMTERLVRRGVPVHTEYTADYLAQVTVGDTATRAVETLAAAETLDAARRRMVPGGNGTNHHGFPVVDEEGRLIGVVTHRDLLDPDAAPEGLVRDVIKRPAVVAYRDNSLREAADHMIREQVGRLAVVDRAAPHTLLGIITRSDLLHAHEARLEASHRSEKSIRIRRDRGTNADE
jgi:CBS domain-containing protein